MKKKFLIVKWQANNYFFKYEKEDKPKDLFKTSSFKKYCKLLEKVGVDNIPLGNWLKKLKNYDVIFFFDSMVTSNIIKKVKEINPNIKVILFFWNVISKDKEQLLKDKNIDSFWTFDNKDAKTYKINYTNQFYTSKINLKENNNPTYDICYLGRDKGRKETISEINNEFIKYNLKTNINVVYDEKDFIKYSDYLKIVKKSKCILDITANNQVGLSLRAMESLFLNKKLITNNKNIKKEKFYKKDNIFIIGEDDYNKLNEFLNKPYKEIKTSIKEKYDYVNCIEKICLSDK